MPTLHDADPRHLAALVAVADHGTFAAAAAELGFTQSAISQQIAHLEQAAGIALFDRPKGPRPAELTAVGHELLAFARRTLRRIDQMDAHLDMLRRGLTGQLVVGTFQSASAELLPSIIATMRNRAPDVEVRLTETDDIDALRLDILNDEIDLAFTMDSADDPSLEINVIGHDPFVVLAPRDSAPDGFATVSDLNHNPLIGQPHTAAAQRLIDGRLVGAGISPDYAFRFSNNAAVQGMVRSGLGWSVMPSMAIDRRDPDVAVLRLVPPLPPRTIQLIRRRGRTLLPAADEFRRIAQETGRRLLAP